MPIDPGLGRGIRQNVKAAAKDIRLGYPCADAQGFDLPGLELRPAVEGRAGFAKRVFGTVVLQLLEGDILVTAPFVVPFSIMVTPGKDLPCLETTFPEIFPMVFLNFFHEQCPLFDDCVYRKSLI